MHFFLWNGFSSWMLLSLNICSILKFRFTITALRLVIRTSSSRYQEIIKKEIPWDVLPQYLNNSHRLFWEGRTNKNFTHEYMIINIQGVRISLINTHHKLYENILRNGRRMVIWKKYDKPHDVHGFPPVGKRSELTFMAWGVKISLQKCLVTTQTLQLYCHL